MTNVYDWGASRFTPTHVGNTRPGPGPERQTSVHPHACGEHGCVRRRICTTDGSPPRMWGTRSAPLAERSDGRFTPRMWGTPAACADGSRQHRFTPTHVGNTDRTVASTDGYAVHPHACGEHTFKGLNTKNVSGSPPRMWGTLRLECLQSWPQRFTPTHVGNTCEPRPWPGPKAVHPHACGEHRGTVPSVGAYRGSPPRMWGTQNAMMHYRDQDRFTPTHVGNT